MTWLAPGAFAALALLAGPLIVHLLARRNARRVVFPAMHFVPPAQAASVRLRRPSDIGLLLLRLAIVTIAVIAAAQPLLLTRWRLAQWNGRLTRAVVVDTSANVPAPEIASQLADEQMANVFGAHRWNTPILADGIERAGRWLESTAPSRREIVVISDFQLGALDEAAVATIPSGIGVRLIRAGVPPESRTTSSAPVESWRGGIWQATTTIDAAGTRTSWSRRGDAGVPGWISVLARRGDEPAADRALRAAASPGVPAGDSGQRIVVRFAGADGAAAPQPVKTAWIASAAIALKGSDLLQGVDPVVVSEREGVMVVDAPLPATDLASPAVIRAAMLAVRPERIVDPEAEISTMTDADLARWQRDAEPVTSPDAAAGRNVGNGDARWLWGLALLLLAIESRVRRMPAVHVEARADAA
jgi:hypothetical protein